ncbi:uncharacterized protein LOC125233168 isoform X2 [Leguminivora glycinivorella]|uniref:uncharacterized protein LOC125233168 isoform X2 n=1 Tax=Leguminivora glycinivorella TaxID=1035111 RepID=UPI00200FF9D7|nr:uncharacterized protein LOC125233168 isoform X2 [Leguminivora glycinivorella]
MSDMIINDSVPVDKKWNELIKYNIFIMKLVEFVISVALMAVPFMVSGTTTFHCLAVAPTLVLSLLFIVLYLVDQVHDLAEQSYLIVQIICNVFAVLSGLVSHSATLALIGLLNCHLIFILTLDLYWITRERGFALAKLK